MSSDPRGAVDGEAEVAGGDRRQGDRLHPPAVGEREGGAHGGGELLVLVPLAHPRAHGVDHLPGLEVAGAGHHRRAHRGAADPVALLLDRGPPLDADRPGDAGAELELLVGGVDDRVDVELGDVPLDQLELRPVPACTVTLVCVVGSLIVSPVLVLGLSAIRSSPAMIAVPRPQPCILNGVDSSRAMWSELKQRLAADLARVIQERFGVEHEPVLEVPPRRELGDLSSPAAMQLARVLKRNPRAIAEELAAALGPKRGDGARRPDPGRRLPQLLPRPPRLRRRA